MINLLFLNFIVTFFITSLFLIYEKISFLSPVILTSTVVTYFLVIYFGSFVFFWSFKIKKIFLACIFVSLDILLIIDFFIYKIYKFHINGMVMNIIFSPSAWDNIHIGISPFIVTLFLLIILISFEMWILKNNIRINFLKKNSKKIILFLIAVFFIEKIMCGIFVLNNKVEFSVSASVFPFYQKVSFSRFAYKYFGIKPSSNGRDDVSLEISALNYPLKTIEYNKNKKITPDIYLFVSDAVRNSIVNNEVTPNIFQFGEENIRFFNHYSGGNATRFGIFSLMYGLNSSYWFSMLNETKGSVLFEALKELDYDINIISSSNLFWPEFRKTCFADVTDFIKDDYKGEIWEKDEKCADFFIDKIKNDNDDNPDFYFVFFDSPHGPYSYDLERFSKFKPDNNGKINYLAIDESKREIVFNQYRNSVFFNDYLIGNMLDGIKKFADYHNSIIILTSDHGEEFYESGSFGHNGSFSKQQTNSFLCVKWPEKKPEKIERLTSHIDIIPTIMKEIGVKNDIADYSNGIDLFDGKRENVFISKWTECAVKTDEYTVVFPYNKGGIFGKLSFFDKNYIPCDLNKDYQRIMIKELENNSRFFKKVIK